MPKGRTIASALLLFTGVCHLLVYFAGPGAAGGPGVAVFGAIYFVLGLALRQQATWPLWLSVLFPGIGGLVGGWMLRGGFFPVVALFVAIDVAVVVCCVWLIVSRRRASSTSVQREH
jgi:hypothetical protein